ncbi:MAG: zf-HC2 domain-containing protein [Pseudomonadota bacterium]
MNVKNKKEHLTEEDILLYCDNELSHEEKTRILHHLDFCDSCKQLVDNYRSFLNIMNDMIPNGLYSKNKEDCLGYMDIANYIENNISHKKRKKIEEHLSTCGYCLHIVIESMLSLKENVIEKEPQFLLDNIINSIFIRLREEKAKILLSDLKSFTEKCPLSIRSFFIEKKSNIEIIIKNTFALPTPRYAFVFGEHRANVLSPFGKVRFPVVFKWIPFEKADNYIVSIDDIGWEGYTSKSKIKILEEEIKIKYKNEYMWRLKVRKGDEILDEITGFIQIATEEEIKELQHIEIYLKNIESKHNRLMIWAIILEEKEFYIEAIQNYIKAYEIDPTNGLAFRIAYCYDCLELEELRDEWNKKIR